MPRRKKSITVTLDLPAEFVALCRQDKVEPGTVLRGFIADLCMLTAPQAGYIYNGTSERDLARQYYERVGYAWPLR